MRQTLRGGGPVIAQMKCVAFRSAALSPINGASVLPMDAASYDPQGMLIGGNIIIPQRGLWNLACGINWNVSATGVRRAWITVNGAQNVPLNEIVAIAGDGTYVFTVAPPMILNPGDSLSLNGYQSSGAGLAILTGVMNTWMSAALEQAL